MRILLQHTHGGGSRFDPVKDSSSKSRIATAYDAVAAVHEYLKKNPVSIPEIPTPTTSLMFRDLRCDGSWYGHWIVWADSPCAGGMVGNENENKMELVVDGNAITIKRDDELDEDED